MKFKSDKDVLLAAFSQHLTTRQARTTLPILHNALLDCKDGKLTIKSTDLDQTLETDTEVEMEIEGGTTLPLRRLITILKGLPKGEITFHAKKDQTEIDIASVHFKLLGCPAEDMPTTPKLNGKRLSMAAEKLANQIKTALTTASKDESRYVICSVLLAPSTESGSLNLVSTDGAQLTVLNSATQENELEQPLVIPTEGAQSLIRLLHGLKGTATLEYDSEKLGVSGEKFRYQTKLIDGAYPNYRQVIPPDSEKTCRVNTKELIATLSRANLIRDTTMLTFQKELKIQTESQNEGAFEEAIPVLENKGIEGESIQVNGTFLKNALNSMPESEEVLIHFKNNMSPLKVTAKDFTYILMPLRIKD